MDSIRIQNLRCLSDTGFIQIKPITVLLGQNSSGKSTFLRVLPLLKQG
jgi:predicted ATPase